MPEARDTAKGPRLDVYDGSELVEVVDLAPGSHCLGRDTDACDVPLAHASCSRRHARLTVDDRGVVLEDLGSAQGTFVDEQDEPSPLTANERVRLRDGAAIRFADLPNRYIYRSGAPSTAPAAPAHAPARTAAPTPARTAAPTPAAAPPLADADAKRKKLWGAKKDPKALEKWGEAAGSLGGARGDKFLKLLGGAKHGATAKKRKAGDPSAEDLEKQYEAARRRGGAWNRQGLTCPVDGICYTPLPDRRTSNQALASNQIRGFPLERVGDAQKTRKTQCRLRGAMGDHSRGSGGDCGGTLGSTLLGTLNC